MSTGGLLELRPALRSGVVVGPALSRGPAVVHLLKDPVTGVRMEVGAKEHFIIARLDGSRSLAEIGTAYAARFGTRLGDAQWQQMLRLLSTRQLLDGGRPVAVPAPVAPDPRRQAPALLSGSTRMVADAAALLDRLHAATAFARRRAVLIPLLAVAVAVPAAVAARLGELADGTGRLYHQPVTLAAVGCVLWVSLGLHELAHGLVARAYGLRVREIGLRRRWGLLTYLYCEVEDVQFLGRRGRQVAVAAAGAVANLLFLVPFWVLYAVLPGSAQAVPAVDGLLLTGTAMALANLVPLPPLDGYKALGYALGTLRLATESRAFLAVAVRAAPRPGARDAAAARARLRAYPVRLRAVYAGYAVCGALLALAALAAAGVLFRATLPERWSVWTPFLPAALTAAALALHLLGLRAAALRAGTGAGGASPGGAAGPAAAAPATRAAEQAAPRTAAPGSVPPGAASAPAPGTVPPRAAAPSEPSGRERAAAGIPPGTVPPKAAAPPEPTGSTVPGEPGVPQPERETGDMEPEPRPTGSAIVLDGVSKRYGDVLALDGVSLTVARGEFFGVLGPNGAGKTTLVEIVEGMRKADAGKVTVLGRSPWPRDTELLRRIGVQTQTSAFFTRLTAWEHLETVAALQGADRAAARRALELVGLTGKERSRVDDLSGGQRQRLALATALVHEPDLIFLDEPTAALDPEARRALWSVLRQLRGEGRTIVYTTHYLDEAEALCDRVAIIAGGRLVALDSPGALIRSMAAPARLLVPADRITLEQARAVEGAERVLLEGGEVVIETRHANRVLVALGALVDMDEIQTRTATLEDAYLRLTAASSSAPATAPATSAAAPAAPASPAAPAPEPSGTTVGTEHRR